ncbi:MAG: deoxyribonuclease IV [Spirochaetales bacterium]|nr:deoxyribonuclease IV [Spirochaetales bacterium]
MKYVGAHVSAAGGVSRAPVNAARLGARAFALFTRNQKQWYSSPLEQAEISAFKKNLAASGIPVKAVLPHAGYLINPGHPEEEKRTKSLKALEDEALRAEALGLKYLNLHPGTHLGLTSDSDCFGSIARSLLSILRGTESLILVLETTAGQGFSVGYRFEHLSEILDRTGGDDRVGVCIDTSHIFAAGYDLRTEEGYCRVMKEFEEKLGFHCLKAMHLNDSKTSLGSRVDRHACLGDGEIGLEAFRYIMKDPRLDGIPLILETPDPERYEAEISLLYGFDPGTRISSPAAT